MSTILIAYEREFDQIALEKVLVEKGYTVVRSNNGVDALECARREPPQLAVCDILLPKLDGFSLCKKWKQDSKLQTVPFMFYTRRHDDPKYQRFAMEVGADRYLERSSDTQQLIKTIDEVLAEGSRNTVSPNAMNTGIFTTTGAIATGTFNRTGAFSRTGTFGSTGAMQAAPLTNTATIQDGALAASLSREQKLLARINELDANNKQLQISEDRLKQSLANVEHTHSQMADSYRTLLIAATDGYWLLDGEDRIIEVNEAYCNMSGYSKEDLLKLTASDLEIRLNGESRIQLEIERERQQSHYRSRHRRKNGGEFSVEVGIGVISGAQPRTIAIIRDISNREREQANQLQQHKMQQLALEAAFELVTQSDNATEAELARIATESCASLTNSPVAFFCSQEPSQRSPQLVAIFEAEENAASIVTESLRPLPVDGFLARRFNEGRAQLVEQAPGDSLHQSLPILQRLLCLPLVDGRSTIGMLCVANRSTPYQSVDTTLLAKIGDAIVNILRSKRNTAHTLVSAQRADLALQGIIEGLSRVVERHDPYSAGGPHRVAALAVAIAREMGLDQAKQTTLRTAGLLHGVGNIAIPTSLFGKPGSLNSSELALVRTHVDEGYKILGEIEFSGPVAEIVHQHHERLDGSGYPNGLKGDQILIEARILAVADVVEAMCAWRPHRPAPGLDAALKEIEHGRDRLYDGRAIDACVRLFRDHGFVLPTD